VIRSVRRSSNQRQFSWLIVGGGLLVYAGLVVALTIAHIRLDIPLPWWATQLIAPVAYGVAFAFAVRKVSRHRWVGGTLILWAAHLVLGTLTQVAGGQSPVFPPPPLPAMLWVPLLLIPLRDVFSVSRGRRDHRRTTRLDGRRPASSTARTGTGPGAREAAAAATEERVAPSKTEGDSAFAVSGSPAPQVSGLTPKPASGPDPSPTQRFLDEMLARETSGDIVRISFERVAAQLPPAAFRAPLEQVAAGLTEPGYLLVPRRLALVQLGEGLVRAGWGVVAEQFPRSLLAMADDAIRRHLADGQLVLPLDEVVSQMPAELFRAAGPPPEIHGIEDFPALFEQIPSPTREPSPTRPEAASPEPVVEAGAVAEPPTVALEPAAAGGDHEAGPPKSEPAMTSAALASERTVYEELWRDEPAPEPTPVLEPVGAQPIADDRGEAAPWLAETIPGHHDTPPPSPDGCVREVVTVEALLDGNRLEAEVVDAEPVAVSSHPLVGDAAAPARAPAPDVRSSEVEAARRVAALLTPLLPLDVDAQMVDGVTVFTVFSPGLGRESSTDVARLMLPLLDDTRLPWPVEQMTLRGHELAFVLTPLARASVGGPILVTALAPGGSLALLEILCRRAAREGAAEDRGEGVGFDAEHDEPDLLDVDPPTRLRQIASSLGAVGPVSVSALRDAETEQPLYLFLPEGSEARAIGGFAADVARALRKAAELGMVCRSAVLRSGRRRMVIHLQGAGHSSIIVAAGETDRPGLAFRQVKSAALTLSVL
jgi:hypothetical protein